MIACLSKNERAKFLFDALEDIGPTFRNVGILSASRFTKAVAACASLHLSWRNTKLDMQFSPTLAKGMEAESSARIKVHDDISAVLYWGATHFPVTMSQNKIPYYIISDGPYDPQDRSYPLEWAPQRWRKSYFLRQRGIYQNAEHVFTLSEWARKKIADVHLVPAEKITRIGWGPMHFASKFNPSVSDMPYFISIGHEWERKGMDIIAIAGAKLHQKYSDVDTIIAGEPRGIVIPPRRGVVQIQQAISSTAAQTLISHAKALIVGSRFDASPHVIYEALQAGTPVIGTNVCGVAEAIQAPKGGRVVPACDADALCSAMEDILLEEEQTQRRNAYDVYLESGGWDKCARIIRNTIISGSNKRGEALRD